MRPTLRTARTRPARPGDRSLNHPRAPARRTECRDTCTGARKGRTSHHPAPHRPLHGRTGRRAACRVVLSWTLTRNRLDEWSQRTTSIEVPPGQYLSMRLEDGTNVWLSAGTRFEYPLVFAGRERRVKISGEAMFDVEHDADHPFVVETFACDSRFSARSSMSRPNPTKAYSPPPCCAEA